MALLPRYFITETFIFQGGNLSDALVDLTSGVSAHLDLTIGGYVDDFEKRKQLFKMMSKEMNEHSLMCCAITVSASFVLSLFHITIQLFSDLFIIITNISIIHVGECLAFT